MRQHSKTIRNCCRERWELLRETMKTVFENSAYKKDGTAVIASFQSCVYVLRNHRHMTPGSHGRRPRPLSSSAFSVSRRSFKSRRLKFSWDLSYKNGFSLKNSISLISTASVIPSSKMGCRRLGLLESVAYLEICRGGGQIML